MERVKHFKMLNCLALLALVAAIDAARFSCDYTYYKDARGYFKYQEMPLKYEDAKQRCALEGGSLASPLYGAMKAAMMGVMKTRKVEFVGTSIKSNKYGIFSSVDGIRLSEIPHTWAPDEPDNTNNEENCIVMLTDGTLADVKCDEPFPHFCFLSEMRAKTLNACGSRNNDYTHVPTTGSCYKFHFTKLVYDEAIKACEEEGGYLIIINGDAEAKAVTDLYSNVPISEIGDFILSGFRLTDSGEWMTLQGKTIEEAGYAKWAPGEPNNQQERCGSLNRSWPDRLLNDMMCNNNHVFICEKDPEILLCKNY